MRLCYRSQERICFKKEKDISIIKSRERGSWEVYKRSVKKRLYLTIKITTDITSFLCTKEEDNAGLQISKQLDNQEQLFIITDFRSNRKKKDIHKDRF